MTKKIWISPQSPPWIAELNGALSRRIGISPVVADILIQRGFKGEGEILEFLRPSLLNLYSPFAFNAMSIAVERLDAARKAGERILIYGDYDVDGVTSTALLYKVLTDLDFKAVAYIPSRMEEGYGLHKDAIAKAAQAQVKVIITVDCGITAVEEVEYARSLGIDIIITDHHEPPEILPMAHAILNPKVQNSGYPFRDLAGVGVAFKLAQALLETYGIGKEWAYSILEILDLVALGTIADLVPLVDENRIIVSFGLRQMENTIHLGLGALLQECGLRNKPLKAGQIAFLVAPRINAAGRMDSARAGLELLLTSDEERASELARFLSRENTARQETEKEIIAEAVAMLERDPLPKVIVLSAKDWHHGVIGIVASRLVEKYYRPVFLIAEEEDMGKGSARGISGYHVLNELKAQGHLLEKFGGHSQAAGFSLPKENIPLLREALNNAAEKFPEELFWERIRVDQCVPLELLDATLLRELEELAPFGFGNPSPVLAGKDYPLYLVDTVGKEQVHLKCLFGTQGQWEGVAFRRGEELGNIMGSPTVDVAFGLDWNTYRGPQSIQLLIKDIQPKAQWYESSEPVQAYQELVLAQDEIAVSQSVQELELMDWRKKNREEWNKALLQLGVKPHIWDCTKVNPSWAEGDGLWGMIIGIPQSWQAVTEIIPHFLAKGVRKLIFAESYLEEKALEERTHFLSREVLVQIYRVLYDLAIRNNPFILTVEENRSWQICRAVKIFEELGLVKCLRSNSSQIILEWIPATKKLDLDSSLRYRGAKNSWEEAKAFGVEYSTLNWLEFKKKLGSCANV